MMATCVCVRACFLLLTPVLFKVWIGRRATIPPPPPQPHKKKKMTMISKQVYTERKMDNQVCVKWHLAVLRYNWSLHISGHKTEHTYCKVDSNARRFPSFPAAHRLISKSRLSDILCDKKQATIKIDKILKIQQGHIIEVGANRKRMKATTKSQQTPKKKKQKHTRPRNIDAPKLR